MKSSHHPNLPLLARGGLFGRLRDVAFLGLSCSLQHGVWYVLLYGQALLSFHGGWSLGCLRRFPHPCL